MKTLAKTLLCLLLVGAWMLTPSADAEEAEPAARKLVEQMVAGWNAGDGAAFASIFVDDATYRVWNGMFSDGREAIAASHQQIFDTFYKGTNLNMEILRIRPITDDVVAVHMQGYISRGGERIQILPNMEGAVPVLVIVRQADGSWKAALFQNTPMIRMGPPPGARGGE